ncbi:MAG: GerAB/ArcD/ProY family transporter [Bacillota bacterium]
MNSQGKFGDSEAIVLLALSNMSRIFLTFPRSMVEQCGPAAWISSIIGFIIALAQVYLFYLILKPHPGENIVDVTEKALGKIAGSAVNLIYAVFFITVAAMNTREFSEALLVSVLPRTPISIVITSLTLLGILGAHIGLESMARSARLTYPFVLAGIAILLLSLSPQWDITRLFPILGTGPVEIVNSGIKAAFVIEILFSGIIVNSIHGPDMFGKVSSRAMLIGFASLTVLLLTMLMTENWIMSQEMTLPFYTLSRLVYLGRFFQRIEAIFVIIWGFIGILKVAVTLYAAAVILAKTLKVPYYKPLLWPLALLTYVASLIPPDMPTSILIESKYISIYGWIPTAIMPLLVLLMDRFVRRRRANERG